MAEKGGKGFSLLPKAATLTILRNARLLIFEGILKLDFSQPSTSSHKNCWTFHCLIDYQWDQIPTAASLFTNLISILFCVASLTGKDDNSAKSKKGRKVHIDFEDSLEPTLSPKSNGKTNTPVSKGDKGKSGKGDKSAGSTAKAPVQEFKIEEELPKKTKCLMDCEAAEILQGIQERMVVLSADPAIKIPIPFDSGLMYAKRHDMPSDLQAVRKILQPLKKHGVSDSEICMVANLKVESTDEVFALVPSLKLKDKKGELRETLKYALDKLAKLER